MRLVINKMLMKLLYILDLFLFYGIISLMMLNKKYIGVCIMKRSFRIAFILLALCVLVSALAIVASAGDETGAYKVVAKDGTVSYTDVWSSAVEAAADGGVVYLNSDITLSGSEYLSPQGKTGAYISTTLNLNGYKIKSRCPTEFAFMLSSHVLIICANHIA